MRERRILIQDDGGREGREEKGHIIILYKGKFIGEREKEIGCEREKEKCFGEEIEEKIGNLTGT